MPFLLQNGHAQGHHAFPATPFLSCSPGISKTGAPCFRMCGRFTLHAGVPVEHRQLGAYSAFVKGISTINARIAPVAEKPAYRTPFKPSPA
jgi:hypothetical protein